MLWIVFWAIFGGVQVGIYCATHTPYGAAGAFIASGMIVYNAVYQLKKRP